MTTNKRLREMRLANNLTLDNVAKRIGVTRQTVQKYESGIIYGIPSDKIEALAKIYNTTPAYLMGWTNSSEPEIKNPQDTPLLNIYHRLNTRGKEKVLDYASDLAKSPDYTTAPAHPYRIAARGGGVIDLTEEEYKRRQKELENAVVATPETHPWL